MLKMFENRFHRVRVRGKSSYNPLSSHAKFGISFSLLVYSEQMLSFFFSEDYKRIRKRKLEEEVEGHEMKKKMMIMVMINGSFSYSGWSFVEHV